MKQRMESALMGQTVKGERLGDPKRTVLASDNTLYAAGMAPAVSVNETPECRRNGGFQHNANEYHFLQGNIVAIALVSAYLGDQGIRMRKPTFEGVRYRAKRISGGIGRQDATSASGLAK